jgi:hypothetical protein
MTEAPRKGGLLQLRSWGGTGCTYNPLRFSVCGDRERGLCPREDRRYADQPQIERGTSGLGSHSNNLVTTVSGAVRPNLRVGGHSCELLRCAVVGSHRGEL